MPELLLELGTEELPATFVRKAYTDLLGLVGAGLQEHGLLDAEGVAYGTPRRLIVSFPKIRARQEDTTKEQRGPALRAAYDAEGNPTPALRGFCRGQGVEPDEVRKDDQYVWVTKRIVGRSASEILETLIPEAIKKLNFEKSMRWGSSRMRFARPIRWILAAFDGQPVPFEIEGVRSDIRSRGHRFYSPDEFEATTLDALLAALRDRSVEPDPEIRRERVLEQAKAVAGGTPDLPNALVQENVFLTEWPTAIQGEFRPDFLNLPSPVLVTAMAKHEKMFPVRDENGALTNRFVFVRNSGEDDTVRRGAEWVLNARFNDARFFFEEDQKYNLDSFLDKTAGILFQETLGTVRARADRLAKLAQEVAKATGADAAEVEYARQAGLYAKADLSTGLVSELASLQGVIGGEYAKREAFPPAVSWAIWRQYETGARNEQADLPSELTAVRLIVADQLDKLAGYLGLGLVPSGSSDPFGLRRATMTLIECGLDKRLVVPNYDDLFGIALDLYQAQGVELNGDAARRAFYSLMAGRYQTYWPNERYDILDAAIVDPTSRFATHPRGVELRLRVMTELAADIPFIQTATRPLNIVIAARKRAVEYGVEDPIRRVTHSALESKEGLDLLQVLADQEAPLEAATKAEDVAEVVRLLKALAEPINRFFETTMVMDDVPEVRYARLTLMHATSLHLLHAGDFSKLVIEG